jgi:hypothetical protein
MTADAFIAANLFPRLYSAATAVAVIEAHAPKN